MPLVLSNISLGRSLKEEFHFPSQLIFFFFIFFLGTSAAWSGPRALLSAILFLISDVKICQIFNRGFVLHSACVLLVNKSEKALSQTLKATPQAFQSCEMWSSVTVNNKPWVDSIYP